MAHVLCVYKHVQLLRAKTEPGADLVAVLSYDEKPGIQALATTAPDLPPVPGLHPTIMRDHEYVRHGTMTLMAGLDLVTGQVHRLMVDRHRSREFIEFLQLIDGFYPAAATIRMLARPGYLMPATEKGADGVSSTTIRRTSPRRRGPIWPRARIGLSSSSRLLMGHG